MKKFTNKPWRKKGKDKGAAHGGGRGGGGKEQAQGLVSVYKRVPVLPPAFEGFRGPSDRFLQPKDPQYEEVSIDCES